jgi:hypothetical protein
MKPLFLVARLVLTTIVVIGSGWGSTVSAAASTEKLPKGLEAVVKQFAGSYILGTGASHFVTSIRTDDDDHAVAIVGENSDGEHDPNAYTVHVKRIRNKWKIVRYEYVFKPTGKKTSQDQTPPFPYPNWQKKKRTLETSLKPIAGWGQVQTMPCDRFQIDQMATYHRSLCQPCLLTNAVCV